jgi:membrane protease YdiL (CAAX protease family)
MDDGGHVSGPIPSRPDLPPPPGGGEWIDTGARPPATWTWYQALGVYLIAFIVSGVVTVPVLALFGGSVTGSASASGASGPPEILATIVADLTVSGVLLFWLQRWHPLWVRIIRFPARDRVGREMGFGVLAGLVLYPAVAFGVGILLTLVFEAVFGGAVSPPEQIAHHLGVVGSIGLVVLAVVVAPISEELFFRGILFRSLRDRYGFWPGAAGSALLFGLAHYVPAPWRDAALLQTIMVFTGLGLAWIYEKRGNLVANIAAHMTFNAIGVVLILAAH